MWCRYNRVNFLHNPHNRHPIARPWGRGVGCLLWGVSLMHVLPLSSQCRTWYHGKSDHVIMPIDCILWVPDICKGNMPYCSYCIHCSVEIIQLFFTLNMLNCLRLLKIYSHFESYLGFGLTQVDEIKSGTKIHVFCPTQPIPCLLMH